MTTPFDHPSALTEILDTAELRYTLSTGPDGRAVAEFRHEVVGHGMIDMTASLEGDCLRFVAIQAMPFDGGYEQLEWCSFVNMEWALGSLYLEAASRWLDASVAMYLGAGAPQRNHVRYLVTHLADSVRRLREDELPGYGADGGRRANLDEVRQALIANGLAPSTSPDGNTLAQKLTRGDVALVVACYLFDDGALLNVLCRLDGRWRVADPGLAVPRLHAINRELPYGTVNYDSDHGFVQVHLGLPAAWTVVDEATLRWAISTVVATMVDRVLPNVEVRR